MSRFEQYTTEQLAMWRGEIRHLIAGMEARKHLLNADQQQELKNARALKRSLTIELKNRVKQLPLF